MDSLIFELQIVFYFQLFLSANVRRSFLMEEAPYPFYLGVSEHPGWAVAIMQLTHLRSKKTFSSACAQTNSL